MSSRKKIVLCIIVKDREILLLYEKGLLMLPGGHIEWKETPRLAAQREIREELGLFNQPVEVIELKDWGRIGERGKKSYYLYLAYLNGSGQEISISTQKDDGIENFLWIDPYEVFAPWSTFCFWRNFPLRNRMTAIAKEAVRIFLEKPILRVTA